VHVTYDEVRGEIKKEGWGFIQVATLCPLWLDGDESKYLQNYNMETVRNLLLGRQARKWKRYVLFWEITQRVEVVFYRHFGTTYQSHLQGSIPGDQIQKGSLKGKDLWTSRALPT
jgi:hypothetical protein